jgi:hypothetical protein
MSSIAALTAVDIIDDSVSDILDKLFARATDGKTIDYATDAAMPNSVNPLSPEEVADWGASAMKIRYQRTAISPKRRGTRLVSISQRFVQRSSATPFFGYKSEPPTARGFKVDNPVGPAAKALKAMGILTAVADHQGNKTDTFIKLYEATWGVIPRSVVEYVTPNLSRSSGKDLVKFIRSSNHSLFGFNSDAPTVTVDLGRYKPETMINNYQFDWHAISLSLRFIGEFIAKYHYERMEINTVLYMAPVYAEAKVYEMANLTVSANDVSSRTVSDEIKRIAENTMKYYVGSMSTYGVSSMVRTLGKNIAVMANSDVTASIIRSIAAFTQPTKIRLSADVGVYREQAVRADINSSKKPRFRQTLSSIASSNKMSYIPTWRSIHTFVWGSAFKSGFKGSAMVKSVLRLKPKLAAMTDYERLDNLANLATSLPDGIGLAIYTILSSMLASTDLAITEFVKMLITLSGVKEVLLTSSYDTLYATAIATTKDIGTMLAAIQSGYQRASDETHSATSFIYHLKGAGDTHANIIIAIESFMKYRLMHWSSFYKSRVLDFQAELKAMKSVVYFRELKTGDKTSLGPTLSLAHAPSRNAEKYAAMTDSELLYNIAVAKENAVKYSFLSLGYTHATIEVLSAVSVDISLRPGDLRAILVKSTMNYTRKRKTWGAKLAIAANNWETDVLKLNTMTRCSDMAKYCDETLKPIVEWRMMYLALETKLGITAASVKTMLRKHVFPDLAANLDILAEEAIALDEPLAIAREVAVPITLAEMHTIDARVATNRYDALYLSDSDDELMHTSSAVTTNSGNLMETSLTVDDSTDRGGNRNLILPVGKSGTVDMNGIMTSVPAVAPTKAPNISDIPAMPGLDSFFSMMGDFSDKKPLIEVDDKLSLRSTLEASDSERYSNEAYEAYLRSKNVKSGDILIEQPKLKEAVDEYRTFTKSYFLSLDANEKTIMSLSQVDIA